MDLSHEYAWLFVKCTYRTCSILLNILPCAVHTSPLSVQALQSRSCLSYVSRTTTLLKSNLFNDWRFAANHLFLASRPLKLTTATVIAGSPLGIQTGHGSHRKHLPQQLIYCMVLACCGRYLATARVWLLISRSLPNNGSTCHNINVLFLLCTVS
jgi:hypothetical protein